MKSSWLNEEYGIHDTEWQETIPDTPGYCWYYDPLGTTLKMPGAMHPDVVYFDGDLFWTMDCTYNKDGVPQEQVNGGYFSREMLIMPNFNGVV